MRVRTYRLVLRIEGEGPTHVMRRMDAVEAVLDPIAGVTRVELAIEAEWDEADPEGETRPG